MARIPVRTVFFPIILAIVTTVSSHAQTGYTLIRVGGPFAQAHDINNRRQVVGMIEDAGGFWHAVLWNGSTVTDLGVPSGFASAEAVDINERGQVVGRAYATNGDVRAVLWDRGAIINLGTLPGDSFSEALAINNRGDIVGFNGGAAVWLRTP